jgi:hypothetical protein
MMSKPGLKGWWNENRILMSATPCSYCATKLRFKLRGGLVMEIMVKNFVFEQSAISFELTRNFDQSYLSKGLLK